MKKKPGWESSKISLCRSATDINQRIKGFSWFLKLWIRSVRPSCPTPCCSCSSWTRCSTSSSCSPCTTCWDPAEWCTPAWSTTSYMQTCQKRPSWEPLLGTQPTRPRYFPPLKIQGNSILCVKIYPASFPGRGYCYMRRKTFFIISKIVNHNICNENKRTVFLDV